MWSMRVFLLAVVVCCMSSVEAFDQHRAALRAPSAASHAASGSGSSESKEKVKNMSVAQLRSFLAQRSAECDECTERNHLIERAMEVRGWTATNERVVMELSPLQQSADSHLNIHHIALADPKINLEVVSPGTRPMKQLSHNPDLVCEQMAANGTEYCHSLGALHTHASAF